MSAAPCIHLRFFARSRVIRLTRGDGGPVTGYTVELTVKCDDCGAPFQFLGLPLGSLAEGAAMSADGLEARLAIAPVGTVPHPLADYRKLDS